MHKLLVIAATAALAAPAAAQGPAPPPPDPLAEEMVRAIPPAEDIEAIAPALDRVVGAMLDIDVGPIVDAADPYRRHPGYGRPGRTIGAMGSRDDPYFEQRLRSEIYGTTADMARMTDAFAAAAPSISRSVREMHNAIGAAVDDYHRRAPARDRRYDRDDPRDR